MSLRFRRVLGALGSLGLTLICAEVGLRLVKPQPRSQIIRGSHVQFGVYEGVVTWDSPPEHRERLDTPCLEDSQAKRVVFVGDSIVYGSGVSLEEAFPARVTALSQGEICGINLGMPGASGEQKVAMAAYAMDALRPDLIVYGIWSEVGHYERVADAAYWMERLPSYGRIPSLIPLSEGPAGWLISHSRLWEYLTIAAGRTTPPSPEGLKLREEWGQRWQEGPFAQMRARAEDEGIPVVFAVFPPLNRPLEAQSYLTASVWADSLQPLVSPDAFIDVGELLSDQSPEVVRRDPCCHYNPVGHQLIAERMEPVLQAALLSQKVP